MTDKNVTRRELKAFAKAQAKLNRAHKKAERRLQKAEAKSLRKALNLQAAEYKRRLKILNGEQKRIAQAGAKSISRELYDADKASTDGILDTLKSAEAKRAGMFQLLSILATSGLLFGLGSIIWLIVKGVAPIQQPPQQQPQVIYIPATPGTLIPSTPPQPQTR